MLSCPASHQSAVRSAAHNIYTALRILSQRQSLCSGAVLHPLNACALLGGTCQHSSGRKRNHKPFEAYNAHVLGALPDLGAGRWRRALPGTPPGLPRTLSSAAGTLSAPADTAPCLRAPACGKSSLEARESAPASEQKSGCQRSGMSRMTAE